MNRPSGTLTDAQRAKIVANVATWPPLSPAARETLAALFESGHDIPAAKIPAAS